SPQDGMHMVQFDGVNLPQNNDFGFLPSRDAGDAPDSYATLLSSGGANHGIVSGLSLGTIVDRELNGVPTSDAQGDDNSGTDDEDGILQTAPLGQGRDATFALTTTNNTSSIAYVQGFLDFNGDGDFDADEQFLTDFAVPANSGTVTDQEITVSVPALANIGTTFARFRISPETGLGATGFVQGGEVEDYQVEILQSAAAAQNDSFEVTRSSFANELDVLANDFAAPGQTLSILSIDQTGTNGRVVLADDRGSVFYTPPAGLVGTDRFSYSILNQFGDIETAEVTITISFVSSEPIAVDDAFDLPEGTVNFPLNVLDNDVASINGGLTIIAVTPPVVAGLSPPTGAGSAVPVGGGQSIRYTPPTGFNGTAQFTYTVQDPAGLISTAEVTINLLPGSQADDEIGFTVELLDAVDRNPIENVRTGEEFLLRILVDDLDSLDQRFDTQEGVASAFLDLIYSDALVSPVSIPGSSTDFPFDIEFGPLFRGSEGFLNSANASTPGLFDEVGGVQSITNQTNHAGPVTLFTIRMIANSPGVAQFITDVPDAVTSENIIIDQNVALADNQIRLGRGELVVIPDSDVFVAAVDDAFSDGRDSNGASIVADTGAVLDVLDNDNLGVTDALQEPIRIITLPGLGEASVDDRGTADLSDDVIIYTPRVGANGLDTFRYEIITEDNIRSSATVTVPVGNAGADDIVAIDLNLVNESGNPITEVSVGDRFGIQVIADDLRGLAATYVFAAYTDLLYDNSLIRPTDTPEFAGDEFDFDVEFGDEFVEEAGVGTAAVPGIINEFGSNRDFSADPLPNPALVATLFFEAVATGTARVVSSPADSFPFQDTLLFQEDQPVPVEQIRYGVQSFNVTGAAAEFLHNESLAMDVNNDGSVSPIDALLVINRLTSQGPEGEDVGSSGRSQLYLDVTNDGRVSPLDALQVINYLVSQNGESEAAGEAVAPVGGVSTELAVDESAGDAVFEDLSEDDLLFASTDVSPASNSDQVAPPVEDDEEEESIYGALADDVQQQWG
ncbi:MAG: Ig-like domain-containing protein, partial [Planctomycetota bacterium]